MTEHNIDLSTHTNDKDLLSFYMEYVPQLGGDTASIEGFCSYAQIEEEEFTNQYSNIEEIEQHIWRYILNDAIDTVNQDPQFATFGSDEKLLSLYYTFFESLTLNEEYFTVHLTSRHSLQGRREIAKEMKTPFNAYIQVSVSSIGLGELGISQADFVNDLLNKGQQEAFWIQFLCLIDFWNKDQSEEKEKTDIAIEKSVRAAIDLLEIAPVKSLFDLGKFLWQERSNYK